MADTELHLRISGDASGATTAIKSVNTETLSLKDAMEGVGASGDKMGAGVTEGAEKAEYSMMEARHSVMMVGEELGVHVPRAVSGMIASIEPLGPLLEAAFPILGALALVEVVEKVAEHFEKAKEEAAQFTSQEQEVANKSALTTQSLELENLKIEDQIAKLEHGATKNTLEEQLLETNKAAGELAAGLDKDNEKFNKLMEERGFLDEVKEAFTSLGKGEDLAKTNEALENVRNSTAQLAAAQAAMDAMPSAEHQQAYSKALTDTAAVYTRSIGTLRDYGGENDVFAAQISSLTSKVTELAAAHTQLGLEQKKVALEGTQAADEQALAFGKAAKETADKLQELQAATERTAAATANLATEEDEFWSKVGLDQTKQAVEGIKSLDEAEKKLQETTKALNEEQTKASEATLGQQYKQEEMAIKELVATKAISAEEGNAQLLAAAQKEADAELVIYNKQFDDRKAALDAAQGAMIAAENGTDQVAIANAQAAYNKQLVSYEQMQAQILKITETTAAQKEALEDQSTQRITNEELKALDTVNSAMTSNLNNWIQGHESFGRAAVKMWVSLETQAVKSLLQIAAQEIEGELLHKSLAASQKLTDAETAAAGAWASASSVPVIGWVLGPIAAAAAFAGVLAFDEGGMMPETGMALIHAGEGVLTPQQTETLQRAADNSDSGLGGNTVVHNHTHNWNAVDGQSVAKFFKNNSSQFGDAMRHATRNGHFDKSSLRGK